jgi:hypothetical protein
VFADSHGSRSACTTSKPSVAATPPKSTGSQRGGVLGRGLCVTSACVDEEWGREVTSILAIHGDAGVDVA